MGSSATYLAFDFGLRRIGVAVGQSITAEANALTVVAGGPDWQAIDRLMKEDGYQTVDVVSLSADHPQKNEFRQKFLSEHTHSEDEVRFFVGGEGLFTLHIGEKVFEVLCTEGDLISVPANTTHWFDMGPNPNFIAIRLFNNPEGWIANFTGSDIADRFNRLEN